jgi:hypothetical protein
MRPRSRNGNRTISPIPSPVVPMTPSFLSELGLVVVAARFPVELSTCAVWAASLFFGPARLPCSRARNPKPQRRRRGPFAVATRG